MDASPTSSENMVAIRSNPLATALRWSTIQSSGQHPAVLQGCRQPRETIRLNQMQIFGRLMRYSNPLYVIRLISYRAFNKKIIIENAAQFAVQNKVQLRD